MELIVVISYATFMLGLLGYSYRIVKRTQHREMAALRRINELSLELAELRLSAQIGEGERQELGHRMHALREGNQNIGRLLVRAKRETTDAIEEARRWRERCITAEQMMPPHLLSALNQVAPSGQPQENPHVS